MNLISRLKSRLLDFLFPCPATICYKNLEGFTATCSLMATASSDIAASDATKSFTIRCSGRIIPCHLCPRLKLVREISQKCRQADTLPAEAHIKTDVIDVKREVAQIDHRDTEAGPAKLIKRNLRNNLQSHLVSINSAPGIDNAQNGTNRSNRHGNGLEQGNSGIHNHLSQKTYSGTLPNWFFQPVDILFYTVCAIVMLVVLGIAAYDQMNDEAKSAEVLSNAKHIAVMDAAERRREAAAEMRYQQGRVIAQAGAAQ